MNNSVKWSVPSFIQCKRKFFALAVESVFHQPADVNAGSWECVYSLLGKFPRRELELLVPKTKVSGRWGGRPRSKLRWFLFLVRCSELRRADNRSSCRRVVADLLSSLYLAPPSSICVSAGVAATRCWCRPLASISNAWLCFPLRGQASRSRRGTKTLKLPSVSFTGGPYGLHGNTSSSHCGNIFIYLCVFSRFNPQDQIVTVSALSLPFLECEEAR